MCVVSTQENRLDELGLLGIQMFGALVMKIVENIHGAGLTQ